MRSYKEIKNKCNIYMNELNIDEANLRELFVVLDNKGFKSNMHIITIKILILLIILSILVYINSFIEANNIKVIFFLVYIQIVYILWNGIIVKKIFNYYYKLPYFSVLVFTNDFKIYVLEYNYIDNKILNYEKIDLITSGRCFGYTSIYIYINNKEHRKFEAGMLNPYNLYTGKKDVTSIYNKKELHEIRLKNKTT